MTHARLSPAQRLVQSAHAAIDHALAHPADTARRPVLVALTVPDTETLDLLAGLCDAPCTRFREPDRHDELTALAIHGTPAVAVLLSEYPPTLKGIPL